MEIVFVFLIYVVFSVDDGVLAVSLLAVSPPSLFFLLQAIFYADNSQHVIIRVSLDGSGSEEVVLRGLGSVGGVVVDWVEGAVLYSDSTAGVIASMDIETMTNTTLLSSLSNPGALALHSDSSSRCAQHVPGHTCTACNCYVPDAFGESEQAGCIYICTRI